MSDVTHDVYWTPSPWRYIPDHEEPRMTDIEVDVPEPSPEYQVRQVLAEIQPWLLERNREDLEHARRSAQGAVGGLRAGRTLARKNVNRLAGERYVIRRMGLEDQNPFAALDVLYGLSLPYDEHPEYRSHWRSTWVSHVWTQHRRLVLADDPVEEEQINGTSGR